MKNKFLCVTAFILGASAATFATWKYTKRKYEMIAQEEIDSVKEVFSKKEKNRDAKEKTTILDYETKLQEMGYTNYSHMSDKSKTEEKNENGDKPYIITPEIFGENDDYETITFTYYADGVLTDDNDDVIGNSEEIVGSGFPEHFGEYEDDSVFVRNDKLRCDYEILRDQRRYYDEESD